MPISIPKHSLRDGKEDGHFFVVGPDGNTEGDTLNCCHCGLVWQVFHGSGKKRGWCHLCGKPTCGKRKCGIACAPMEKQLEQMEARGRLRRNLGLE